MISLKMFPNLKPKFIMRLKELDIQVFALLQNTPLVHYTISFKFDQVQWSSLKPLNLYY
jgi:hypothetical protein